MWKVCKFLIPLSYRPGDVEDSEYDEFYKSVSKTSDSPMAKIHFTAEGEVTFKSILFVPKTSPNDMFQNYGKKMEGIKVWTTAGLVWKTYTLCLLSLLHVSLIDHRFM